MLLRISLILAILLGAGTIFVTQKLAREHFTEMRDARDKNAKDRDIATARYTKDEKTLAATSNVLNQTKQTLAKTEEELNGTKQQLATVQESLNKTTGELKKTVEARNQALAELEKWRQLNVQPDQVRDMIATLQKNKDAIAALEDEKQILSRRVIELTNKLMIIMGPEDYVVPLPAGTKANVVAVDPKWNFVVLDQGKNKGMLEGGVLMVHRNSQLVGKVRIREVLPNRSVASPLPGWKLGEIEEGDQAIY
jgi:hypothetical protein